MASAGFEPANLGTKGQNATPRPPKPSKSFVLYLKSFNVLRSLSIKQSLVPI